jgi:SAM-dependent methyltransferase
MTDLNPQARQMADESMVRNLSAQAQAIWPQEKILVERYGLPADIRILDAGCGTGEASSRLAEHFPRSQVLGVDIIDAHLDLARTRCRSLAARLAFENRSIFELGLPDGYFDLVACRHVLQSIPHPEKVLAELARVTRPGGRLHIIAEDYGMLNFERGALDSRRFWSTVPDRFGDSTGTDLFIGRHIFRMLAGMGLQDIRIDYVIVDTQRVERETFARIMQAWRDGYAEAIGQYTPISQEQAIDHFNQMIANIRDPQGYALWLVPVASARVAPGP